MTTNYWPFYCEENVWHLCVDPLVAEGGSPIPIEERRVIVIAGTGIRVAMRGQRAGGRRPVLWDYHVVLGARGKIWDLDTTLGLPVDLDLWTRESFLPQYPEFRPRFRVVDAPTYRERLASDRSHMRGPDGAWLQPPPPWPPIGEGMTLPRFINMDAAFDGEVYDLGSLRI